VALNPHPLVVRYGALGDMVMLTALLRTLYERCGHPCDVVGAGRSVEQIYRGLPYVRNIYYLTTRRRPFVLSGEQQRLVAELRARGPGPTWLLEPRRPSKLRWLISRAGVPSALVVDLADHRRRPEEHEVAHLVRLGRLTPADVDWPEASQTVTWSPHLAVSADEHHECHEWLAAQGIYDEPIVVVHPGNRKTQRVLARRRRTTNRKYWPEDRWAEVIRGVLEELPQAWVLISGVPAEHRLANAIKRRCTSDRVLAVANQLPLRRLFALLHRAHSCITVDTGPAHAAAALDCPVAVLFGASDPRRYAPVGEAGKVVVVTTNYPGLPALGANGGSARSMHGIEPEEVLHAWRQVTAVKTSQQSGEARGEQGVASEGGAPPPQ